MEIRDESFNEDIEKVRKHSQSRPVSCELSVFPSEFVPSTVLAARVMHGRSSVQTPPPSPSISACLYCPNKCPHVTKPPRGKTDGEARVFTARRIMHAPRALCPPLGFRLGTASPTG